MIRAEYVINLELILYFAVCNDSMLKIKQLISIDLQKNELAYTLNHMSHLLLKVRLVSDFVLLGKLSSFRLPYIQFPFARSGF